MPNSISNQNAQRQTAPRSVAPWMIAVAVIVLLVLVFLIYRFTFGRGNGMNAETQRQVNTVQSRINNFDAQMYANPGRANGAVQNAPSGQNTAQNVTNYYRNFRK